MKRSMLLWMAVLLVLLGLACSGLPTGNGSSSSSSGVDITVVNNSPDDICYVLISPSTDDSWGDDQLGGDEVISSGTRRVFNMDDGTYDVRVETCDQAAMATAWEVSKDTTVTAGDSKSDVRLLVTNDSSSEVCYIYVSPTDADDWGDDWMGDMESLPPGQLRIFYVPGGTYDVQAVDCDDNVLSEEYEVDLNSDMTWQLTD